MVKQNGNGGRKNGHQSRELKRIALQFDYIDFMTKPVSRWQITYHDRNKKGLEEWGKEKLLTRHTQEVITII